MAGSDGLSSGEFATAFRAFLETAVAQAPSPEPYFRRRLTEHLGVSPTALPIVAESLPVHEHPNLQLALDDHVKEEGRAHELLGVSSQLKRMGSLGLGDLTAAAQPGMMGPPAPDEGPVDYLNLACGQDEVLPCVQFGLYLISGAGGPLGVLLRVSERGFGVAGVTVEVMATERADAEEFLAAIRQRMRTRNVYRGRIVSLSAKPPMGNLEVKFHHLPQIERDRIIMPFGLLERIERQTIRFAAHAQRLAQAGRHLKRGLLLWGPPGTGKTLTAMYLAHQMPERTVLMLTGQTLGLIEASCSMARRLQPATVILEDVDLVAEQRTSQSTGTNAVLFELLNQMDGLGDDADVLFILTTNRPELLESALASRPGRVDEAIEVPLPDSECRSRLLDLYGRGLILQLAERATILERTEGVSASFIKELLRKGALLAAEASPASDDPLTVTDEHLEQALADLTAEGGALTRTALGVTPPAARRPSCG